MIEKIEKRLVRGPADAFAEDTYTDRISLRQSFYQKSLCAVERGLLSYFLLISILWCAKAGSDHSVWEVGIARRRTGGPGFKLVAPISHLDMQLMEACGLVSDWI